MMCNIGDILEFVFTIHDINDKSPASSILLCSYIRINAHNCLVWGIDETLKHDFKIKYLYLYFASAVVV